MFIVARGRCEMVGVELGSLSKLPIPIGGSRLDGLELRLLKLAGFTSFIASDVLENALVIKRHGELRFSSREWDLFKGSLRALIDIEGLVATLLELKRDVESSTGGLE